MLGVATGLSTFGLIISVFAIDSDLTWGTSLGAGSLCVLALCGLKIWLTIEREKNDERCSLYRSRME